MTSGIIATAPSLEEARRLSASYNVIPVSHGFLDDTETPVSAFLKLRQPAGCFLLESAEQGLRLGRYSFLGVKAWESIRLSGGVVTVRRGGVDASEDLSSQGGDPFTFMARHLARYRVPPLEDLPPFVGGAVGYFGYDCVRHVERLPASPPDDLGLPDMAFLLTDVVVVFDHLRHTITLLTNIFTDEEPDIDAAYAAAVDRLAGIKARLRAPLPLPEGASRRDPATVTRPADHPGAVHVRTRPFRRRGGADPGVHPRGGRVPGGAVTALRTAGLGRRLLHLSGAEGGEPQPVHVLHLVPRLRGGGIQP